MERMLEEEKQAEAEAESQRMEKAKSKYFRHNQDVEGEISDHDILTGKFTQVK